MVVVPKKAWFAQLMALALGALLAVGFGFITDYWLYGEWVCAPYNYFFSNIMEGKAANFGCRRFGGT
jgi:hypothetical protein